MSKELMDQIQDWAENVQKVSITPSVLEKLGSLSNAALKSEKKVDAYTFTYKSDGTKIAGFLIAPKNRINKLPAIIYNRGGTEDFGLVTQGMLFTELAALAEGGYIVLGTQYPGNLVSEGIDERGGESDVSSVLRLHGLINNLGIADVNRIGMYGISRGGMMTYLCLSKVTWIKAALTIGGQTNLDRTQKDRPEMTALYEKSFGNKSKARDDRSAVKWVEKLNKSTPLCLLHGTADDRVNVQDALELAQRLNDVAHPYELHLLLNGDHSLKNVQKERDYIVQEWFDSYLKR
jgi:dipeptidyl aminopeptidase/acylaminoacyl peptidase